MSMTSIDKVLRFRSFLDESKRARDLEEDREEIFSRNISRSNTFPKFN